MRRPCVVALLALLLATQMAPLAISGEPAAATADAALAAHVQRLAAELRCLVCQNQTLADSDASLARDLREQIRTMLRDGADDDAVRRYMTDRYGDFVLVRPPLKDITLALWFGPLVLLLAGLAALVLVLRRRSRLGVEHFDPDDDLDAAAEGVAP
jgi:cytochrome c-type biogenesis protein CcmH